MFSFRPAENMIGAQPITYVIGGKHQKVLKFLFRSQQTESRPGIRIHSIVFRAVALFTILTWGHLSLTSAVHPPARAISETL